MLYKLAKMIKEARDNVIFIKNKLDSTDSIQALLQKAVDTVPDDIKGTPIFTELTARLAKCKRIGRRMRMKYEPLLNLLGLQFLQASSRYHSQASMFIIIDGLGGDASHLKSGAEKLRKGLGGVNMAIGTVTKMLEAT